LKSGKLFYLSFQIQKKSVIPADAGIHAGGSGI